MFETVILQNDNSQIVRTGSRLKINSHFRVTMIKYRIVIIYRNVRLLKYIFSSHSAGLKHLGVFCCTIQVF